MKMVTFNIRCDCGEDGENNFCYRSPHILEKIEKEKPELICFQEVLPHVALWLKENLKDYYVIGCGRDEAYESEQMTIAYHKTKLNLMSMEVFWLSETPHIPASRYEDQSECPRICTEAVFEHMDTREVFRIFNIHLDHVGSKARELGLKQVLHKAEQETMFSDVPFIIAGDFNAYPDSKEMEVLKQYPNIVDITKEIKGTFHDYGRAKIMEKIDYILVSDKWMAEQVMCWTDCKEGVYLSDHYPVCAEIKRK